MKYLTYIFLAGLILLLVGCASETQPLPDIDVAVEEKITEERFRCIATFSTIKNSVVSQSNIPEEQLFSFKLKSFESPSRCDDVEGPQLRKCWELDSPIPHNHLL